MDDLFWSKRLKDKNTAIVINDASIIVQEASLKQANSNIRQHFNRHGPKLDDKNRRAVAIQVDKDDLFHQAEYSEKDDNDDDDDEVALVNFKARTYDNRKCPHDALGDDGDSDGNEQATMRLVQKNTDQSEEATIDSVEDKASDKVETSSQVVNQRQPKRARKANERQSKKTSSSSMTGCAKEACAANTLNPGTPSISETEDESQEQDDVEGLIKMIKRVDHNSCSELKMNRREEKALDELSSVKDRRLRNMYEHLIINLPRREDPPDAEETLVTNFISPKLHAFVQNTDAGLVTHYPNTNSKVQKQEGVVPDRPGFKLTLNGVEASYGEVTGYQQRADKGKNGFDLWRLARFGKFILDRGTSGASITNHI
ncbi:hypothetical protein BGW38_004867 [Lunasporangiospora selenospora]|uniref:Uncharacterized protein n=1 Tax=Lunasporangiospora selenospora TaxID=979761 RepID=A0A9P6FP87_9FUNG|nr:hypothetical protein BGW38_004867 [Lunasporangiospora selenospora]